MNNFHVNEKHIALDMMPTPNPVSPHVCLFHYPITHLIYEITT